MHPRRAHTTGLAPPVDQVAARTTGFSGASLANLLNEAAIVTARRDKEEISISEVGGLPEMTP